MDLLNGNLKRIYFKYLLAAFGSSIVVCIYSLVDVAMVGQYHGSVGTSALAIVSPIWSIIYAIGLLFGIGGSIMFSYIKGKTNDIKLANKYFTSSIFYGLVFSILVTILIIVFEDNLLYFFGVSEELLPYCKAYLKYIKFTLPFFVFSQLLTVYLRNDDDPTLAVIAIVGAGVFNMVGDYLLVFVCDMGIEGAGIATMLGAIISFSLTLIHFLKKKNTLKLVFDKTIFGLVFDIFKHGFPSFIVDLAIGILSIIFNNQIMKYLNQDALSIYGVIVNISIFVQCSGYGVGQGSQPILSKNFGANKLDRVVTINKYASITTFIVSLIFVIIAVLIPDKIITIFMKPSAGVLKIAPFIFRTYAVSYLLFVFNIYSTYFFQSILKSKISLVISLSRSLVVSGLFALILPLINKDALWFTMPLTELVTFLFASIMMLKSLKNINEQYKRSLDHVN